jgi:predicted transposase/invertase (TIGR01784 family)
MSRFDNTTKEVSPIAEANREYKNSIFTTLFNDNEKLISLYNAITGSNYPPDTDIKINTLKDVLYMDRYNDLSFTIDGKIVVLIEHQSTLSGNFCIRLLIYAAKVYEKIIDKSAMYRRKRILLPKPEFIVLYNGQDNYPKEQIVKLSDAFIDLSPGEMPQLELTAKVLNINYDKNPEMVSKDQTLEGYSYFVYLVKEYSAEGLNLEDSIKKAMELCIRLDKLKDFLKQHGTEVINMLMSEWNMEDALRIRAEEAKEEGIEKGIEKGKEITLETTARKMIREAIPLDIIAKITGFDFQRLMKLQKNV